MKNLKVGLEIHIQLDTGKLFCPCSCDMKDTSLGTFRRTLYPTSGELGKTDQAALFELSRGRIFEYTVTENSCLVEMDEEPPHPINEEAVRASLAMSVALNCQIFPEIFVMRKIVIDGSNTTGFQRTSLVGIDGNITIKGKKIGIPAICLEEDSARKLSQHGEKASYSLDRLGIPLVEISTDPDMKSAEEAMDVAREIGYMVASTGLVRQGAESIRQDVNMSLGFGRVEIKGVSKLSLIRDVVNGEMERQLNLAEAAAKLRERGEWKKSTIVPLDVSGLLKDSGSRIISSALKKKEKIVAIRLSRMKGLLKSGNYRLGREIADSLKPYGIMGILHGDELPGYGIEEGLIEKATRKLNLGPDDSYALIAVQDSRIPVIRDTVAGRIEKVLSLDFSETRSADNDGNTSFLRPLPGKERMYPETDIPAFTVSSGLLEKIRNEAPESFEKQVRGLSDEFGISSQDASTIIRSGERSFFLEYSRYEDPKLAARILIHVLPQVERELSVSIDRGGVLELIKGLSGKGWTKVSIEPALRLMHTEKISASDTLADVRIRPLSGKELKGLISELKKEQKGLSQKTVVSALRKKADRPFDPVLAMEALRDSAQL